MIHKRTEKGQALILIVLAIIGLVGMTALTVDGGMAYSDRRSAQNAADSAALAAALAYGRGQDTTAIAQTVATSNGYDNNGSTNIVSVSVASSPSGVCPASAPGKDITVEITSQVDTYFGPVIGVEYMTNTVTATTRSCESVIVPLFYGNAVVGLNPSTTNCAFDSGESNDAEWTLTGGGIFSNGCAYSKNNDSVTLNPPGTCVTTVGSASNFTCAQQNQAALAYDYPEDIAAIMPPVPVCDGTLEGGYVVPDNPSSFVFTDGVYCVSDFDDFTQQDVILTNATLYVTDMVFDVRFSGHGGFQGTAPTSGPYKGYYMVVAMNPTPCPTFTSHSTQVMEYRGNGLGDLTGTILAPSACVDYRGNANDKQVNSQIIGYNVSSNGTAGVNVAYEEEDNRQDPIPVTIQLLQ